MRSGWSSFDFWVMGGIAGGLVVGVGLFVIGGAAGFAVAAAGVILAPAAIIFARLRWGMALVVGDVLRSRLEPDAGPRAAARRVSLPLAERYVEAVNGRDWRALRALMGDGFTIRSPATPKALGAAGYVRAHRMMRYAFPDLQHTLEAVLQEGEETWVRLAERGRSRSGEPIDAAWWERWTLDADRARLLAVEDAGVVRVDM